MTTTRHIFLSPHLDDVPLSCGGTLHELTAVGLPVQVISIFAGLPDPEAPISDFARYQHDMWGNPQQAYHTRRAEDKAALALFDLEPTWLDFYDCIYRGQPEGGVWYYNSDDDIFGAVHPAELALVAPMSEAIEGAILAHFSGAASPAQTTLYAPLTVGRHVDHQLAFLAALHLYGQGYRLCCYEEYPYADRDPANIARALHETTPALLKQARRLTDGLHVDDIPGLWGSVVNHFSGEALQAKIQAVAAYATQLDVLFGGREAMIERVTTYARTVGRSNTAAAEPAGEAPLPGERFWYLLTQEE